MKKSSLGDLKTGQNQAIGCPPDSCSSPALLKAAFGRLVPVFPLALCGDAIALDTSAALLSLLGLLSGISNIRSLLLQTLLRAVLSLLLPWACLWRSGAAALSQLIWLTNAVP